MDEVNERWETETKPTFVHSGVLTSTNQSSREASELRLKRQVVGKCELSMLLATTTTCRQIAEDSPSASIGQIAAVDLGLER
ncbi:unnamed protein product [Prunus armeniaca]